MEDPMLVRLDLIHERLQNLLVRGGTFTEDELLKQIQLVDECNSKLTSEIHFYLEKRSEISKEKLRLYTKAQLDAEEWKIDMKTLIKTPSDTPLAYTNSAKLPKLTLPKFKGQTLRWAEFWDRFRTNVHEKPLPDSEKMAYLVGCLEEEALEAVEGLHVTELNYKVAIDILKERFGNPRKVIDAHYEAINNLPRATQTATECRANLDTIEKHLRILQSLGEVVTGNHLRSTILGKFPEKVVYELHLLALADNIENMREGLRKIITALESSSVKSISDNLTPKKNEISTGALHINTSHQKRENKKMSLRKGFLKRKIPENKEENSKNKKPKMACIFCQGSHYNADCTAVKDIIGRKKKLGKRCYLCFKEGHKTSSCYSKKSCYFCKERHNQALCPRKPGSSREMSMTSMSLFTTNDIRIKYDNSSYLQTAVVEVGQKNSTKTKTHRLVLDNGSSRSYITKKLAKELNLIADQEDELLIFVFGADNPVKIFQKRHSS